MSSRRPSKPATQKKRRSRPAKAKSTSKPVLERLGNWIVGGVSLSALASAAIIALSAATLRPGINVASVPEELGIPQISAARRIGEFVEDVRERAQTSFPSTPLYVNHPIDFELFKGVRLSTIARVLRQQFPGAPDQFDVEIVKVGENKFELSVRKNGSLSEVRRVEASKSDIDNRFKDLAREIVGIHAPFIELAFQYRYDRMSGDYSRTLALANRIIQTGSPHERARAYNLRGVVAAHQMQFDLAYREYARSNNADPTFELPKLNRIEALLAEGKSVEAKRELGSIKIFVDSAPALAAYSGLLARVGETAVALKLMSDLERSHPLAFHHDPDVIFDRACLKREVGDAETALDLYQLAEQLLPHSATAIVAFGWALLESNPSDLAKVEKLLERAMQLEPASPYVAQLLGEVLMRQRRYIEAFHAFKTAMPSSVWLRSTESRRLEALESAKYEVGGF